MRRESFVLLISYQLREELEDVLRRQKFAVRFGVTVEVRTAFLFLLDTMAEFVEPLWPAPVAVRDPKDEIVLATAIGGQADYLVTGDDDLLVLAGDPRIGPLKVVTVREFLQDLDSVVEAD